MPISRPVQVRSPHCDLHRSMTASQHSSQRQRGTFIDAPKKKPRKIGGGYGDNPWGRPHPTRLLTSQGCRSRLAAAREESRRLAAQRRELERVASI